MAVAVTELDDGDPVAVDKVVSATALLLPSESVMVLPEGVPRVVVKVETAGLPTLTKWSPEDVEDESFEVSVEVIKVLLTVEGVERVFEAVIACEVTETIEEVDDWDGEPVKAFKSFFIAPAKEDPFTVLAVD